MDVISAYNYISGLDKSSPEYKVYINYVLAACNKYNIDNINKEGFKEILTSTLFKSSNSEFDFKAVLDKIGERFKENTLLKEGFDSLSYVSMYGICLCRSICSEFLVYYKELSKCNRDEYNKRFYKSCTSTLTKSRVTSCYSLYDRFLNSYINFKVNNRYINKVDEYLIELISNTEEFYFNSIIESPLRCFRDSYRLENMSLFSDSVNSIDYVIESYKYRKDYIPELIKDRDNGIKLINKEINRILDLYRDKVMELKVAEPLIHSLESIKNLAYTTTPWKISLINFMTDYVRMGDLDLYLCTPVSKINKAKDFCEDLVNLCNDRLLLQLARNNIRYTYRNMMKDCGQVLTLNSNRFINVKEYKKTCIEEFFGLYNLGVIKSREEAIEEIIKEVEFFESNV